MAYEEQTGQMDIAGGARLYWAALICTPIEPGAEGQMQLAVGDVLRALITDDRGPDAAMAAKPSITTARAQTKHCPVSVVIALATLRPADYPLPGA